MNKKFLSITIYFCSFIIVSLLSYFLSGKLFPINSEAFKQDENTTTTSPVQKKTGVIEFEGPKTQACPLNGVLYTKEEEKIWLTRRPLLVMIENHVDSRPQSGLSNADIVYEAVAEGGITRFMGVFYCDIVKGTANKYDVGPVRSARTYFLDIASEYADYPLYAHVGGANCSAPKDPVTGRQAGPCTTHKKALAIEQISDYGWNNKGTWGDLSQFSLSYKVCRREPERIGVNTATEHTMYCSTKELWNTAADRGLTNETEEKKSTWDKNYKKWSFTESAKSITPEYKTISFDFWAGYKDYSVSWQYDSATNRYLRFHSNNPHLDINNNEQLAADNIVIQYVKETRSVDEHLHNLYDIIGSGNGVLLQNGTKTEISWSKANRTARTIYKDTSGKEIKFVAGKIWIELLPIGNKITYEN